MGFFFICPTFYKLISLFLDALTTAKAYSQTPQPKQHNISPVLRRLGPEDGEAVDENGQLKDAADMVWFNDKDDTMPISSGTRMFLSNF